MAPFSRRSFLIAGGTSSALALVASPAVLGGRDQVRVTELQVDGIDRPVGLENPRPYLSWRLNSKRRNVRQSAYQIWVASSEAVLKEKRGDLWNSGRVLSR